MATTLSDMHNAEEHDEEGSLKAGNIIFWDHWTTYQ
jgi:hypothetical protein